MKKIIAARLLNAARAFVAVAFGAGVFTARPAFAEFSVGSLPGKFTGNIALLSEYIAGGISASNNKAAVQGGFDWDSGMGVGAGVQATNIDFRDNNLGTSEFHWNVHYSGTIGRFLYEGGVHYFWYPGVPAIKNYNFWAPMGKIGYDFGVAKIEAALIMPDNFRRLGKAAYFLNSLTVPIVKNFKIETNVGHILRPNGAKNLTDWNIGGVLNVYNWFDLDVRYYDSDIKFLGNLADSRLVVKIKRSF